MQTANELIGVEIKRGDCDLCGHWSGALIAGVCACCDDRNGAPDAPAHNIELATVATHMIPTASGEWVDLVDPDPATIYIDDIAHHLARINRFTGGTSGNCGMSVAQHSVWVALYLETSIEEAHGAPDSRLALYGLLHDAHEAYLGDITRPLKAVPGIKETYARLEQRMQATIHASLGLVEPYAEAFDEIRYADGVALRAEVTVRCIDQGTGANWEAMPRMDAAAVRVNRMGFDPAYQMEPLMAQTQFLLTYHRLAKAAGVEA